MALVSIVMALGTTIPDISEQHPNVLVVGHNGEAFTKTLYLHVDDMVQYILRPCVLVHLGMNVDVTDRTGHLTIEAVFEQTQWIASVCCGGAQGPHDKLDTRGYSV